MSQVTVHSTPSDEIINAANKTFDITDARGRLIKLKKPPFRTQFKLAKILGNDADSNRYLSMYFPLFYIHSIDGIENLSLWSIVDLEALIDRLDEDGYMAVIQGIAANFPPLNNDEVQDKIKK